MQDGGIYHKQHIEHNVCLTCLSKASFCNARPAANGLEKNISPALRTENNDLEELYIGTSKSSGTEHFKMVGLLALDMYDVRTAQLGS